LNLKPSVTVVGIAIIDLVAHIPQFPERGGHISGSNLEMFPGAPGANVATGLARLGVQARFLGGIGDDYFGNFLQKALRDEGVQFPSKCVQKGVKTGIVFVIIDQNGRGEPRSFSFRENCADLKFLPSHIKQDFIRDSSALFIDGVLLLTSSGTEVALTSANYAREEGITVFFDPNLRLPKWSIPEDLKFRLNKVIRSSDIILLNEKEAFTITGCGDLEGGSRYLLSLGVKIVGIKRGRNGCYVTNGKREIKMSALPVEVVDTNGAGDSFDSGFIASWCWNKGKDLEKITQYANLTGALAVTKKGAWPALPTRDQMERFLRNQRGR